MKQILMPLLPINPAQKCMEGLKKDYKVVRYLAGMKFSLGENQNC